MIRFVAVTVTLFCAVGATIPAAWANEDTDDGFIDLKGVADDEAWSGGVLKTVFSTLGVHVAQLTYHNPGPHELTFTAKLFVDHDEQNPIEAGGISGPMDLDEEELSLAAVIREGDDGIHVLLRAPEGSAGGTALSEPLPTGRGTFGGRMRNMIAVDHETPVYCLARTNTTSGTSVFGRSDSHLVATYEWVIIVYAKISPLKDRKEAVADE